MTDVAARLTVENLVELASLAKVVERQMVALRELAEMSAGLTPRDVLVREWGAEDADEAAASLLLNSDDPDDVDEIVEILSSAYDDFSEARAGLASWFLRHQ